MKQRFKNRKIVITLLVFTMLAIGGAVLFFSKQEATQQSTVTKTDTTQTEIASISEFSGRQDIDPQYVGPSTSSYDEGIPVHVYTVGPDQYELDARNGKVIQFGTRSLPVGNDAGMGGITITTQTSDLESSARQFIQKNISEVNFDTLTPNHGDKGENRFFRWEDRSRNTSEGYPFVEVGFSQKGLLIGYVNTL